MAGFDTMVGTDEDTVVDPARAQAERRYMIELGQRVRALREERGLTQHTLARSAGIATDMVSRLENGHYTSPGLRTLLRLAEGLGLSVTALLPDGEGSSGASPEGLLRARLVALVHRMDPDDLELLLDIGSAIASRRRS